MPVALFTRVPAGAAYILSQGSVTLFHDGVFEVKWGVTRPIGVVRATIAV